MELTRTRGLIALTLIVSATACASTKPTAVVPSRPPTQIVQADVEAAQRSWCAALVQIGYLGATGGNARATATDVLSEAYDYDTGTVLFKPTLTFGAQTFRTTKRGALAYFVGGDSSYPDDSGFALKHWVKCEPKVIGVVVHGDMAIAMGNVYLEDAKGNKVTVDKSFGYLRHDDGALRIVLHHSSLPYVPAKAPVADLGTTTARP